jgi:glyoxylase-like metal-dependent hydrolase (beta-lactamase superfamily II)
VQAVTLHRDVIVVTSALLAVNCTLVRGPQARRPGSSGAQGAAERTGAGETFMIDSPVLPEELGLLASLLEQSRFPPLSGLLATHADWDHLLGPLAFPGASLGCAQSSADRLAAEPGAAQRELRSFDEELYIQRERPLVLGSVQALSVPGRCEVGEQELELHPAEGHTRDGMAVWIGWAGVLVAGDYLSPVEIPALNDGDRVDAYLHTLERLRPLVALAAHVVPGHGRVFDPQRAMDVLEQDLAYLHALRARGPEAELPAGRRSREQRRLHERNVATVSGA